MKAAQVEERETRQKKKEEQGQRKAKGHVLLPRCLQQDLAKPKKKEEEVLAGRLRKEEGKTQVKASTSANKAYRIQRFLIERKRQKRRQEQRSEQQQRKEDKSRF